MIGFKGSLARTQGFLRTFACSPLRRGRVSFPLLLFLFLLLLPFPLHPDSGSASAPTFPDLPFLFLDGKRFSPALLLGKVTILNIFATWCAPCIEELPALERVHKRAQEERAPLQVLGFCGDLQDPEKLRSFAQRHRISYPVAYSLAPDPFAALPIQGYPTTFLLDAQGRIVRRIMGPQPWDAPRWWDLLKSLFPSPPGPEEPVPTGHGFKPGEMLFLFKRTPVP